METIHNIRKLIRLCENEEEEEEERVKMVRHSNSCEFFATYTLLAIHCHLMADN